MLEHSSELALVQSLYANSMRCPPSAAGISVRNEDLSMRYVGVGPSFKCGVAFVALSVFGLPLCLGWILS